MSERWLVTGALGCIGSWVVRVLVDQGAAVTTLDLDTDGPRLDLVVGAERLTSTQRLRGDISELAVVQEALEVSGATHVVHLAALQIPFCKADPSLGARVNVVGTVNVFEAARQSRGQVRALAYASSAAAVDALEAADPGDFGVLPGRSSTIYGVFKRANEGTAQVYWADHGIASIGLRPHTVYGPGRDQGVTSQPTQAMRAAAHGESYHIAFGGKVCMQYTQDVAEHFIAAARAAQEQAHVVNVEGDVVSVEDIVEAIAQVAPEARGRITHGSAPLSFPADLVIERDVYPVPQRTALLDAVSMSVDTFRREVSAGRRPHVSL